MKHAGAVNLTLQEGDQSLAAFKEIIRWMLTVREPISEECFVALTDWAVLLARSETTDREQLAYQLIEIWLRYGDGYRSLAARTVGDLIMDLEYVEAESAEASGWSEIAGIVGQAFP